VRTTQEPENWAVEFIRPGGDHGEKRSVEEGFATRGDAEYYGQCTWASPGGRGIEQVRVRQLPRGPWLPVTPASVCGGIRL
jgi:hypothetical protein